MGEVDTKSIESVQAAISLFGEKNDQRHLSVGSEGSIKEEWELMLTDLANYKVQLEVKEYAYKQALLKIETCQITNKELCGQLKKCEAERDGYIEDCREARKQVERLELRVKEISDLLMEARNSQVQLVHVVNELNATNEELDNVKTELAASEELKVLAMTRAEKIESSFQIVKEKTEGHMSHVTEFNETVCLSELAATEVEKENPTFLSENNEVAKTATEVVQAKEHLVELRESMQELEKQLSSKNQYINSLQLELKQAEELHSSSEQAASSAINALIQIKSEFELVQKENSFQANHIKSVDTELAQLQSELINAKAELGHLNLAIDILTCEIENATNEIDELGTRESEGQVEIALLKAEIHKGRAMVAAAESAEARAMSVKSGLYLAVKQLATEAEAAKREAKMLKLELANTEAEKEIGDSTSVNQIETEVVETGSFIYMQDLELAADESATKVEAKKDEPDSWITISKEEYESLIQKAQTMDQVDLSPPVVASHPLESEITSELNALKNELEYATIEIEELKSVAEQAMIKAELAEKAKAAIENQLRMWRNHKQKRRADAIAALREELSPTETSPPKRNYANYGNYPTPYQPLGKVLNMKF